MIKKNNENPYFVGFVPHKLEVEERPELNDFSQNILFANFFQQGGFDMVASALYEPDLETYKEEDGSRTLTYKNIHNPDNTIEITRTENGWMGRKTIADKRKLIASGAEWSSFFSHLTMNGLSKGERCKF